MFHLSETFVVENIRCKHRTVQFSLTREVNLKIKEFNYEKAGFRAIHAENDADMFISWRRIINDATDFSTHQ